MDIGRARSDLEKVQAIADCAGISKGQSVPLGQGATSMAWQVTDSQDSFVIRYVPIGINRPITYQSEFTILRLLHHQGCSVPEPVINSFERAEALAGIAEAWAVTKMVPGHALKNRDVTPEVAYGIGNFLAQLHTLPVINFGRLVEHPGILMGQQIEHLAGICARWCWAALWPFDNSQLAQHPIARLQPELIGKVQPYQALILQTLCAGPIVLTHSDLHGEHLFQHHNALSGVIDFGAACISVPAWDFAVLAFYHGWAAIEGAFTTYELALSNEHLRLQAQMLALVVGLYKLSKAVAGKANRLKIDRILQFLSNTLDQID